MTGKLLLSLYPVPSRKFLGSAGFQWVLVLAIAAGAWALWPRTEPTPPRRAPERANRDGFLAIAYGGIGTGPGANCITPQRFREHMEAIASAGYWPITLEEVHDFLLKGVPLPDRAILLTFDDGRRDTVEEAEKTLSDLRFPGTLLLRLEPIERSDHFFANWHALRSLAGNGRWSFGAKGLHAFDRIPACVEGRSGLFLTTRTRSGEDGEIESQEDWERRACGEFEACARLLEKRIPSWTPTVFAFPCSDGGQGMEDRGEALGRNVTKTFPLAFSRTGYGFNHWRCPRSQLTRLAVSPRWSGNDLLGWLEAHGARRSCLQGGTEKDWVLRHGKMVLEASGIVLEPSGSRGAEAWLAGTEHWRCVRGKIEMPTRPDAQAWLYLRATPGRNFLRLGWTGKRIEVQVKVDGERVRPIASGRPREGSTLASISFDLMDRRIRFAIEEGEAPDRSYPIPEQLDAGMAGLGVWHLGEGSGPVSFEDLRLEPRLPQGAIVRDVTDARKHAPGTVDVIAPLWFSAEGSGSGFRLKGRSDRALSHLAAYRGASLWPVVELASAPTTASTRSLSRELDRIGRESDAQGVILDLRPSRAAGVPLGPDRLRDLLEESTVPLGIIPDRPIEEVVETYPLEKLAWLVLPSAEGPARKVPQERLLIVPEQSR
jgi:hypothetical protein